MTMRFAISQGTTLVVSLLLLLILTIIGINAIRMTHMQEKMSHNYQNKTASLQAAESALREGENWLQTLTSEPIPSSGCSVFPCVQSLSNTIYPEEQTDAWWNSNSAAYTVGALGQINTPPRYYIEFERFVPDSPVIGRAPPGGTYFYRVNSKGTGNTDDAITILQTTYTRRY